MKLWKALGFSERGEKPPLRCSFCNKSQRDVRALIAGPSVQICDECVDICRDTLAEHQDKSPPDPGTVKCSICMKWGPLTNAVRLATHGHLCAACAQMIEEALIAIPRGRSEP